ncbi:hypothetical protein MFIFM68171_07651 [Madurella fahalii]|uniref:Uncharacterized protein n=1 Tax=Madurella fahalii TaxID=1157608 RepID=A0ABQ0GI51_9PEZI
MAETEIPGKAGPPWSRLLESSWDSLRETIRPYLPESARTYLDDLDWPFLRDTVWPFIRDTAWPLFIVVVWPVLRDRVWPSLRDIVWPFLWLYLEDRAWPVLRDRVWLFLRITGRYLFRGVVIIVMALAALLMLLFIHSQLAPYGGHACWWANGRLVLGSSSGNRTVECKVPPRLVLREPQLFADLLVPVYKRAKSIYQVSHGKSENTVVDWHALHLATQALDDAVVAHFYDLGRIQDEVRDFLCNLQQFPAAPRLPSSPPFPRSITAKALDAIACSPLFLRLGAFVSPAGTVADRADRLKQYATVEIERRRALRKILLAWKGRAQTQSGPSDDGTEQGGILGVVMEKACALEKDADSWRALAQNNLLELEAEVRNIHPSGKPSMLSSLLWRRGTQNEEEATERKSAVAALVGRLSAAQQGERLAQQCASNAAVSCHGAEQSRGTTGRLMKQVHGEIKSLRIMKNQAGDVSGRARAEMLRPPSEGDVRGWERELAVAAATYLKSLRVTYGADEKEDVR